MNPTFKFSEVDALDASTGQVFRRKIIRIRAKLPLSTPEVPFEFSAGNSDDPSYLSDEEIAAIDNPDKGLMRIEEFSAEFDVPQCSHIP